MRLINADDLMELYADAPDVKFDMFSVPIPVVRQNIIDMPTIDAVEVVRCENCIRYEQGVCLKIYSDGAATLYAWQERKPNDFCSYGKKRGEHSCETCYAYDMDPEAVDNPCWNCKGEDYSMWRGKEA